MSDPKWEEGMHHGVEDQTGRPEGRPRALDMNIKDAVDEQAEEHAETAAGEAKAAKLSEKATQGRDRK